MKGTYWLCALVLLGGSLVAPRTASARPGSHGHGDEIEDARRAPLGATVTVTGTVTVPTGAFDGGFALQQDDAGIYVLDSLGRDYDLGAAVKVTGVLVDSFGLLAIQPASIRSGGHGQRIEPACRSTGSVGERTEGQLLKLRGTMRGPLVDDSPFGFKLDIDDGSGPIQLFLYPGTGIATTGLVDGAAISVVCFSNQFDTHYECDPRGPADLKIGHQP